MHTLKIGFLAFPGVTQLDLTGPYEVLSHVPHVDVCIIAKSTRPLVADGNFILKPHGSLCQTKHLDILVVPGGPGINQVIMDVDTINYIRAISTTARYITSVCTGALALGVAGLLKGKKAVTHWAAQEFLKEFGAIAVDQRVVKDGNIITGGGITAGIDFGLTLAAEIAGKEIAERIQLILEYNPSPPFCSGNPGTASNETIKTVLANMVIGQAERRKAITEALKIYNFS